jgi:hypothetical protein
VALLVDEVIRIHSDPRAHRAAGSLSVVTAGVENEKQASPVDG